VKEKLSPIWKKRIEGFYFGVLFAGFFYCIEYLQEGIVDRYAMANICLIPFITSWWASSKWVDKFYEWL
jgi:hypothetical protein